MPIEENSQNRAISPITHILSVDVEDYFMVEAFACSIARNTWNRWPSRVVANTRRTLDLFDQYNAKATFFFVGWVAQRFPGLVREVQVRGHELACHSFWHRTVYSLTADEFREDTRAALRAIEDASGTSVCGYRAPSWSITKGCQWALDILAEEGFTYDSSIFPIRHDLYGVPGAQRFPYDITCKNGRSLREFPPATVRVLGQNLPGAGGGYLRIFPEAYTNWLFRKFEESYRERVVVYMHPWELDPEQPRIREKLRSRVRHYSNLRGMEQRLRTLLQRHNFLPFRDLLAAEPTIAATSEGTSTHPAPAVVAREKTNQGTRSLAERKNQSDVRDHSPEGTHSGAGKYALTYHALSRHKPSSAYTLSCHQFEQHLELVVSLSRLNNGAGRRILVTFDDGHMSNFVHALPLLERHSIRAMFFVVANFINSRADFMTWAQLREIAANGHEVQSHSWSHPLLTQCSNNDLQEEMQRSRQMIEEHLGRPVDALAVPGGRWDARVLHAAAHAGYRRVYVSDPWLASRAVDGVDLIGRLTIKNKMGRRQLQSLMTGEGMYPMLFRAQYRAKELFRRAAGDGIYSRMWSLLSSNKPVLTDDILENPSQKGH